jgi:hypothetical protein
MIESGRDMKRHGGIAILSESDREAATNLLRQLGEYGIFIVPTGELESWLKYLGISGHGSEWLIRVFERMREDAESEGYVKPSEDDVWEFISQVRGWLLEPGRKGIPR